MSVPPPSLLPRFKSAPAGPGCSNFDLSFVTLRWDFLSLLFGLLFWVWIILKYTKHKQWKTLVYKKTNILRLNFNPGLALTAFRTSRPRGPFLERPGKLSGPVSHPVSPRKLSGCFSKFPLFSIPLNFPVTCPVIYGRSWPPIKLPGSHKCCKTKQNGGRRRTFLFHGLIKDAPF